MLTQLLHSALGVGSGLVLARYLRRGLMMARRRLRSRDGPEHLRQLLADRPDRRLVVGSSGRCDPGWIPTDQAYLDLTKPEDWAQFMAPGSVDAILAEHVWEHLTPEEALIAAATCYTYLKFGGYLRVAVPDGLHPSAEYQEWVRVGGRLPGQVANGHRVLYTYETLGELFRSAGFTVTLYEYFDEAGTFHAAAWDRRGGTIWRSRQLDRRNSGGHLVFTSIMLDARKAAVALVMALAS